MAETWNTRVTLLQRAKDPNDHEAWDEFVKYYEGYIRVILYKMEINPSDLDDLTQNILIALWKFLPEMQYNKEKAKFRTWMSRVVKNKVIDNYRSNARLKDKHDKLVPEGEVLFATYSESELDELFISEWKVYIVKTALEAIAGQFSEQAIIAFKMSMSGADSSTISRELGIKPNSVNKLKNRVKHKLTEEVDRLKQELEFGDE